MNITTAKYTKDGKKVVVLGKLNAEEFIVQEIFVSEGQEIPGGENFVAKGLLDAPMESWKDKNLREKEESYDRRIKQLERDFDVSAKRLSEGIKKAAIVADALFGFAKGTTHENDICTLKAFLSGQITHFFVDDYHPKIEEWDSDFPFQIETDYGRKIEGIRLISLYGKANGELGYKRHTYSDGSGSSVEIVPFTSRDLAVAYAQGVCSEAAEKFVSGKRGNFNYDEWAKIDGVNIPKDARDKFMAQKEAKRIEKIEQLKKQIEELEGQS